MTAAPITEPIQGAPTLEVIRSDGAHNPTREIVSALREADAKLVESHPWLGRDDLVALGLFTGAWLLIASCCVAWSLGALHTAWTILGVMLGQSVLHELEHDLIHDLYLSNRVVRAGVFASIWLAKATIDPWTRGRWHRWHHSVSGQEEDVEERLIGLGTPWGLFRVMLTLLPPLALVIKPSLHRAMDRRVAEGIRRPDFRNPRFRGLAYLVTGSLSALPLVAVAGLLVDAPWAWPLLVMWVLPNTIRHAAIVTMSTNSHYTDIRRGALIEQNQILDHPMFWPLQALCWNFGATHVLHHFHVRQPFWRRTLIFREVRQVLVDNGVPRNDLGTFRRANKRLRSEDEVRA